MMISGCSETCSRRPGQRVEAIPAGETAELRESNGGHARILHLMLARERAVNIESAHAKTAAASVDWRSVIGQSRDRVYGASRLYAKNGFGFRPLFGEHRGYAWFQDSGFFGGDLLDRVAEKNLVIVIDRRDHGKRGSNHVGRVQAPAQSHFQNHRVQLRIGEQHESHRRDGLEIGRVHVEFARREHALGRLVDSPKRLRELRPG